MTSPGRRCECYSGRSILNWESVRDLGGLRNHLSKELTWDATGVGKRVSRTEGGGM